MKKLINFIPTHILFGFSAGIVFRFYISVPLSIFSTGCLCLLLLLVFRFVWRSVGLIYCISFLLGVQGVALHASDSRFPETPNKTVLVRVDRVLKSSQNSFRYYVHAIPSGQSDFSANLLMTVPKQSVQTHFEQGALLLVFGTVKELPVAMNPFAFDYGAYLRKKNVNGQLFVKKGMWVVAAQPKVTLKGIAAKFRNRLIAALKRTLTTTDVFSVTVAMLLGERQYISKQHMADFSDAGIVHLLAVSGLHVGILNYLLYFLFNPLGSIFRSKWFVLLPVLTGLWSFAFVAGLSASVVRAVTMFSFVSVGVVVNKKTHIGYSLVSSALFLLLFNPFYVFDLGFQMSYLAVISIVVLQPKFYGLWISKYRVVRYFWSLATVSFAAQIGVLPLSLYCFHQFPGLFLVANIVVIPFVGLLLVSGILVLIWSIFGGGASLLVSSYNFLVSVLNTLVAWVGNQEAFVWKHIFFSGSLLLGAYFLIVSLVGLLYYKRVRNLYVMLASVIVFQLLCLFERDRMLHRERWVVFQQYKESLVLHSKKGESWSWGIESKQSENNLRAYSVATGLPVKTKSFEFSSVYQLPESLLFVIDKSGVYKVSEVEGALVLLKDSPRINFERMLCFLQPKMVIADGSSYPYLKEKWRQTCLQKGIPFWDTSVSGALVLDAG